MRVLVDRPGTWEAEWVGSEWDIRTRADGATGFSNAKALPPSQPGDLDASRLGVLIALPPEGEWKLSFPVDSGAAVDCARPGRLGEWDPVAKTYRTVAPSLPPTSSLENKNGFRLLHLDLPLARTLSGDRIHLTRRLRIKLEWNGAARLRPGSIWSGVVDNPGGIRFAAAAGRIARAEASDSLAGNIASFEIGDADLFGSREDGLVRLTGKQVADALKIDIRAIRMSSIAVWSGPSDTLPSKADSALDAPALRPIPLLRRDLDGDDIFGATDEILFWAHGPNSWVPDSSSVPGWSYTVHPYARTRRYLIRWDAAQGSPEMGSSTTPAAATSYEAVPQPVNIGKPVNRLEWISGEPNGSEKDMGIGWFWMSTSGLSGLRLADSSKTGLPGIAADTGWLKVRSAVSGKLQGTASQIASASLENGGGWKRLPSLDARQSVWTGRGLTSSSAFRIGFTSNTAIPIQDFQVTYLRDVSSADSAMFPAPGVGPVAIRAKDGRSCLVLEDGVAVRTCTVTGGYLRDSVRVPGTWFALYPPSSPGLRPALAKWSEPVGSHVVKDFLATRKVDVLVVSPRLFLDVAEQYAKHREASFQVRPLKVAIAALDEIYDLWSGGMADPVAIRDAVRWASARWQVTHVLLLGGGHADPRNALGSSPASFLPHWQYLEEGSSGSSESSDDFYAGLVSNGAWAGDVAVGRVPARTVVEAQAWLDKLVVFEDPSKAEFGPWRNRLVFTADDMYQNATVDHLKHTEGVEKIAHSVDSARPWIRSDKIYLVQYPVNAIGQKPEAARDLQNMVNQGVAGMCYLGHGGMGLLADENLLDVPAIERTFKNPKTPFLFTAGSCTVGRNDLPNERGLADALVTTPGKGAFATVAATRPTYSDANEPFMTVFWTDLTSPTGGERTLGEVLLRAKLASRASNNVRYNLLGDPAMIPFPGGLTVEPDSVQDTLPALSKVRYAGTAGTAGWVQSRIDIPQPLDSVVLEGEAEKQVFLPPAQQFLSSQSSASSGAYSAVVGLPARVPFGSSAFIKTYAWDPKTRRDGGAKSGRKLFWGTASTGSSDDQGPRITVRPCDSSWSGGLAFTKEARFPLPFCLAVDVEDSSGVSFDQGPDEGLVLAIPGIREAWHPDLIQLSDYRSASANLILDSTSLEPGGDYALDVSARDLMGNLSRARVMLHPQYIAQPGLYEVFNSPNPVKEGATTTFYFKLTADADTNGAVDSRATASIRIHTVSGRLVRVLRTELSNASSPLPRAVWDLRDSFGNPVANGLYPFRVLLRIPSEDGTGSIQREAKGVVAVSR